MVGLVFVQPRIFSTHSLPDIFRTSDVDQAKLESSSYLDMGWLYGHNAEQQKAIRTFKNGTLKPDAFSETELLSQPPGNIIPNISYIVN